MKIVCFTLVIILMSTLCLYAEKEVIIVLPFINTGAEHEGLFGDLLNSYFYLFLSRLKEFEVIYPSEIINFRAKNLYNTEDLYTIDVLKDITKHFDCDFIFGGEFSVENSLLTVTLDFLGRKKIILKREYTAKIKDDGYEALTRIAMEIIKALSGYNPATAVLKAHTLHPCSLYVDGIFYGRLPGRHILPEGEYNIEIRYEDDVFNEVIFQKHMTLTRGQLYDLGEIEVLAAYEIKANVESGIYCNGKRMGVTDLMLQLPVGNEFDIEIVYADAQNERRYKKERIDTTAGEDGSRYYEFSNRIKTIGGDLPFLVRIGDGELEELPHTFDDLETGTHRVQVVLDDQEWSREWVIHEEKVSLNIAETAIIDKRDFEYKKNWALCFVPGAAQFRNFERKKGITLMVLAGISLIESVIVGYLAYNYYNNTYLPNLEDPEFTKIQNTHNTLKIAAISGITVFGIVYFYSCIDGMVTMNHIYKLLYF